MDTGRSNIFVERLSLQNYKSVGDCDVSLRPLTVIVGRNGSGKSNFLDGLHFIADALVSSLDHAIRTRGGAKAITHKLNGPRLRIRLSFRLSEGRSGEYELALDRGLVRREELSIAAGDSPAVRTGYVRDGRRLTAFARGQTLLAPTVLHDRLALVALSGAPEFRDAYDALSSMRFYRFNPEAMRTLQDPDEGNVLRSDGSNLASVWEKLQKSNPRVARRLTQYVAAVVPEIKRIHRVALGPKETLHFHQVSGRSKRDLMFHADSMSDGTLRALGALVASRPSNGLRPAATIIGIEEPETALHPAAVAALMDALHEASANIQIILTTNSPDVLDHVDVDSDGLIVTQMHHATTTVAEVDAASGEAIRRHLYTPGELLRMNQLQPAEDATNQ